MALAPPTRANVLGWPPLPAALELDAGEVQVIAASLDLSPYRLSGLAQTLSAAELDQAARFYSQRDKERFTARRGLLRELLSAQLRMNPSRLAFTTGPFGKPALVLRAGARPLHFSTAHSDAMAVWAAYRGSALGVDIELVRDLSDLPALVATVFSDQERLEWENLPEPRRLQAFFDLWTRKEAFLKGTGQGLQKPPCELDVPLAPCEPDEGLSVCDRGRRVPDWSLRSLSTGSFAVALALKLPPVRVCCWAWPADRQLPFSR
jgi:4'-phosphopantetheinyl transferase